MLRADLEHILRAAGRITQEREFIVLGSQSILGKVPHPPDTLTGSMEADVYPKHAPEKAEEIDGAIGERSSFHAQFGVYAHGVGPETAVLPADWEKRLVKIENENTDGAIGWCLDPHDLAYSKLAAGREKDTAFVAEMLRHRFITETTLCSLLEATPADLRTRLETAWTIVLRSKALPPPAG